MGPAAARSGQTGPSEGYDVEDYRRAGLPSTWLTHARTWSQRDLAPADITPYATVLLGHGLDPAHVADYAVHGLDAATALAYVMAGAGKGALALDHLGCPPAVAAVFHAALGLHRDHEGLLVSLCTAADGATYRTDLVHAFLTATPTPTTPAFSGPAFIQALRTWAGPDTHRATAHLPAAQIVALHHAGYRPADVSANPALGTCPTPVLATLGALRRPPL